MKRKQICTTDGKPPRPGFEYGKQGAPAPVNPASGQHEAYFVLCEEERAKGFVRPLRDTYKHLTCGGVTHMGTALAETYARDPKFYGSTFCCNCRDHFPLSIGGVAQFVWIEGGVETSNAVGE